MLVYSSTSALVVLWCRYARANNTGTSAATGTTTVLVKLLARMISRLITNRWRRLPTINCGLWSASRLAKPTDGHQSCRLELSEPNQPPPPRRHPRGSYIVNPLLSLEATTPENKTIHSKLLSICKPLPLTPCCRRMQLTIHATCRTPHAALRLVQAMSA